MNDDEELDLAARMMTALLANPSTKWGVDYASPIVKELAARAVKAAGVLKFTVWREQAIGICQTQTNEQLDAEIKRMEAVVGNLRVGFTRDNVFLPVFSDERKNRKAVADASRGSSGQRE